MTEKKKTKEISKTPKKKVSKSPKIVKKIIKKKVQKKNSDNNSTKKLISMKSLLNLKKTDCQFYIKKNGDVLRFSKNLDINYKHILCILNKIKNYDIFDFPYLYGNMNTILKKLLIIDYLQKNNYKYILMKKKESSIYPDLIIALFSDYGIEKLCVYEFIKYIRSYDENFYREMFPVDETKEENIIRYLGAMCIQQKEKYYNANDSEILNFIFYKKYIYLIEKELIKKYGQTLLSFKNYKQLYQFLECNGYVKKFYQKMGPKIIERMNEFIKKINNHPLFLPYLDNLKKYEMKDINDFSIYDLIQDYVPTYIDKKKLWKQFNLLLKKDENI